MLFNLRETLGGPFINDYHPSVPISCLMCHSSYVTDRSVEESYKNRLEEDERSVWNSNFTLGVNITLVVDYFALPP